MLSTLRAFNTKQADQRERVASTSAFMSSNGAEGRTSRFGGKGRPLEVSGSNTPFGAIPLSRHSIRTLTVTLHHEQRASCQPTAPTSSERAPSKTGRPFSPTNATSSARRLSGLLPCDLSFPSPLQQHRASCSSLSSVSSSPPASPKTMAAVLPPTSQDFHTPLTPPLLFSSAFSVASNPSTKGKAHKMLKRMSRNISPFSSTASTPSLASPSAFSPASSSPYTPPIAVLAPCTAPTPSEKRPRRLPRKPVPDAPEVRQLRLQEDEKQARAAIERRRQRRVRQSPRPVVDGLWTSTCDERDDLPKPQQGVFPSRRGSSASSASSSTRQAPGSPTPGEAAILLSTSARRASLPSPAAVAGNASLSPRLARIAAFTSTISQLSTPAKVQEQAQHAFATSFELPEIDLPWLPTLFPEGTPLLEALTTPPMASSPTFAAPTTFAAIPSVGLLPAFTPSSPSSSLTGSTLYPTSSHASSSSSSGSSADSHFSLDSSICSSVSLSTPPPASPTSASPAARKTLFRVQAANGTHVVIEAPSSALKAPASPSRFSSASPRLPSLDLSTLGPAGWPTPEQGDDAVERFVDALSTPLGEFSAAENGLGAGSAEACSWVEDDDDGEVLVISRTPRL
ncbi:hypothetical protein JCM10207_006654 [Rhodosporidiobolus poonsookiae]